MESFLFDVVLSSFLLACNTCLDCFLGSNILTLRFLVVKLFDDPSEVTQVLPDDRKLLNSEFFSVVVVIKVIVFNLNELLFLLRLLHVDCVVVEASNVLSRVDYLAWLEVV